ncbi:hypothetical protein C8Q75DRAFT_808668 [Abortiporus biennis]|nr:hypothetical protein C8Q75DRAFT_808668 [Abortiporus biennis]
MKLYLVHGSESKDTTLCLRLSEITDIGRSHHHDKGNEWKPMYRIDTPGIMKISKPTSIFKVRYPNEDSSSASQHWYRRGSRKRDGGNEVISSEDEIAKVEWHTFRSSRIVYKGQILNLTEWLAKTDIFGTKRAFQGMDGRSYEWSIGPNTSSLTMEDSNSPSNKIEIARMHQQDFLPTTRAYINIDDRFISQDTQGLLDLIVVTWVYIETTRIETQPESGG